MIASQITFVSINDLTKIFGSRTSIHVMRQEGLLPEPVNPYGNRKMFPSHEIDQLTNDIAAGLSKDQRKQKVIAIMEARKELAS
ncbi:putative AlpA family phage regulatory protein [Vibrio crassostreae]|nr:hypothetical protein VCHA53O468_140032 [Vibrio chagasii]CAK1732198.1 putative AlpA family phage regulatory protein [Vibrio crassostreae]CAH7001640.1 hypothetical protein VCHA55O507_130116 [Vibrio chagasii]CAH7204569.1 hypothetical protein VCHA38O209_140031 [Vibrio chagasii]CAH7391559.1 hypothetical protein VCHA43P273_60221 [Vibrio chagasii]